MTSRPIEVGEITDIWSFLSTIDWNETWLHLLLLFHISCFMLTVLLRARTDITAVMFFVFLILVYFSEYINEWGANNWKSFSKQQYFDSNGMFISFVFSAPLLLNCLIIVINWVIGTFNILVKLKRAQIRHQASTNRKEMEEKNK